MKPILKYTLISLLVVGLVGITAVGIAYAQSDDPYPRETLAELLGLTREKLREELQDGKTLEDLAESAGVDLDELRESMNADREENLRTRIEKALAAGDISQEQAAWLLEGLEKGFLVGPFGMFGGRAKPDGAPGYPGMDGEGRPGPGAPRSNQ